MAIKRPAKSRGTPVRKAPEPASARHVELKPKQQLVPGEVYLGWLCKNKACGLVLAIAVPPPNGKPAGREEDDRLTALKCPHCGDEDLYRWGARRDFAYAPKSAGS